MEKVEDYSNYKVFCLEKLSTLSKELPDYSIGELLQCVKHYLKKDTGKAFFEAEDSEVYRAISIAIEKEKNNK